MIPTINFLTILIPPLALLGGLSLGVTVPLWFLLVLYKLKNHLTLPKLRDFKPEFFMLAWALASCCWSENPVISLKYLAPVFTLLLLYKVTKLSYEKSAEHFLKNNFKCLIFGLIISGFIFLLEYYNNGLIARNFRVLSRGEDVFHLHMLDRGCSFLSSLIWAIIANLLLNHKKMIAGFIYIIALSLLLVSDSLAGFVAFASAGLVFAFGLLFKWRLLRFTTIGLVLGSLAMPVIFYSFSPLQIIDHYNFLPLSAKHRVFIWNFTTNLISEKPIIGHGFAYSKIFEPTEKEIVTYQNTDLYIFSSHPHNNILQVLLETGVIGLLFFFVLVAGYLESITSRARLNNGFIIALAEYSAFISYYAVGMISYNIWQWWWICAAIFISIQFVVLEKKPSNL